MTGDPTLFDQPQFESISTSGTTAPTGSAGVEAVRRRDEAIARVDRNADDEWKRRALSVIEWLAHQTDEFTTDEVWDGLAGLAGFPGGATHEPRALGAMMKRAAKHGLIEATDRYRNSVRPECHARPVRIWASRVR